MPRRKQDRDVSRARRQRREMSLPEVLLWQLLRGAPDGGRFRRQHPLGPFVLDFYCAEAKVCIEIDGWSHETGMRPERDTRRDAWLAAQGIEVMRVPAAEVLKSPEAVAESLVRYCRG